MSRIAQWGLIALAALWPVLMLLFDQTRLWTALSARGSFIGPLILLLALCRLMGASRAALLFGLLAGAAAASLSGPLFSFGLPGAYAYAAAALLAGSALIVRPGGASAWAVPIAAGAQAVALILLARRQFGLGGAIIESDYAIFCSMLLVWAAVGAASHHISSLSPTNSNRQKRQEK
jgi:hypothetical protein